MSCIDNLAECLFDYLMDFMLSILNAPVRPLMEGIKTLLSQPPSIALFAPLWSVIVYVISAFYGLFLIGVGFNFIISGYDPQKRAQAKAWLYNIVLMILFVQSSYLLYTLISEITSSLAQGVINIIDPQFFLFTLDNLFSAALELTLGVAYVIILLITFIIFSIIYLLSSVGVLLFPFGVFFYFIPPLRDIGKTIMSTLIFTLSLPFFSSLILLGGAELSKQGLFSLSKIILAMGAFTLIDVLVLLLALLAIARSVMGLMRTDIARGMLLLKGVMLPPKKEPEMPATPPPGYSRAHWDYLQRR